MENIHNQALPNLPSLLIDTINGVKFTPREIDVLACILEGRTAKKIASFLSISPKTIENHIYHIMLKLECNSRESIKDFLESSDQVELLKNHYKNLSFHDNFERKLKEISKLNHQALACVLVCKKEQDPKKSFVHLLEKHLKMAGLEVSLETQTNFAHFSKNVITLQTDKHHLSHTTSSPQKTLFLVLENGDFEGFLDELKEFDDESVIKQKNYYLLVFQLFKKLFPQFDFERIIGEFKQKQEMLNRSHQDNSSLVFPHPQGQEVKGISSWFTFLSFLKIRKWQGIVIILIIGLLSLTFLSFYLRKQNINYIRSDLAIPMENAFLNRSELLKQIDDRFKGKENIKSIALVGIGGAGKTTLARQYAREKQAALIWEINSETQESVTSSFESLAHALAQTEEDQKVLRGLLDTKKQTEKEQGILDFVKKHLVTLTNWFLIYDNIEKFIDIQNYFPVDDKIWGQGKIILTTRNRNIQNNKYINHCLLIGELNEEQKLNLFTKIMHQGTQNSFSHSQKEEIKKFLEAIPPFPLDISIAAYYIRTTHLPYNNYLEELNKNNLSFSKTQEDILAESADYKKTRYNIIKISLQRFLENDRNFSPFLLFISLLDSQDIPKELLERFKNPSTINDFLYSLKNHSLISIQDSPSFREGTLSLHRSTQDIIFAYLTKFLNLNNKSHVLQKIIHVLDDYLDWIVEEEDFQKMQIMARHIEKFLSHSNLLTEFSKGMLESKLGSIYYFTNSDKTKKTIDNSLELLNKEAVAHTPFEDKTRFIRSLLHLANIYTELRFYKEAEKLCERAIQIYNQENIKNDVELSWVFSHLGNIHRRLGGYEKARSFLEKSIALHKQSRGDKKRLARTLAYLGSTYRGLGLYQKSIDALEESLAIYNKNYSGDHFRIGWTLTRLGNVYSDLGDFKKAKQYFEKGLLITKKYFPEDHVSMGLTLTYLGNCYRELGEYEKSRVSLEESLKVHQKHFDKKYRRMGWILFHLATTYKALGYDQKAQTLYDRVLEIYAKYCDEEDIETAGILRNMARVCLDKNRFDEAENLVTRSLKILQSRHHVDAYRSLETLGDIYLAKSIQLADVKNKQENQNLRTKAGNLFHQAFKIAEPHFPKNSAHVQRIKFKIESMKNNIQ